MNHQNPFRRGEENPKFEKIKRKKLLEGDREGQRPPPTHTPSPSGSLLKKNLKKKHSQGKVMRLEVESTQTKA